MAHWREIVALIAALIVLLVLAATASAQAPAPQCGPRGDMLKAAAAKYSETTKFFGISGISLIEILTSNTGSWTVLATRPDGLTCVIAAGEDWNEMPISHPSWPS